MTTIDPMFVATPLEKRNHTIQQLVRTLLLAVALLLVVPALLILGVLVVEGAPGLSWSFLVDPPRSNGAAGGIGLPLLGTLWLTAGALLLALPLGVAAAIYLSEYARDNWLTRTINVAIVNLAGVPSIVHALFGVGAFVHFLHFGKSILAASCTLAVMTLPVVIVATRESLQAVPKAFREACWSMGATRWQTIWRVVLPNSGSGILTGLILCVCRAVGETAPIMFTGAVFLRSMAPQSVFDKTMALSLHLFNVSTQLTDVPHHLPFSVALVLIIVVLALNGTAIAFRMRLRGRKKW
ncbi:MAG: phosphate ABC transporter permease PstA [Planctomycetes bacterium]|jgi:phosphate transport system permease protein|nr:phosphate ABC transporter permease PstA [Planctomycetota bacterium]